MELSENASDVSDASTLQQLVDVMFREAGIAHKDEMTFDDFRMVFASKEYASTLQAATLANQGRSRSASLGMLLLSLLLMQRSPHCPVGVGHGLLHLGCYCCRYC